MKIQMQISKFNAILLRELKRIYEEQSGGVLNFKYNGVIKKAWYSIKDEKNIDWVEINEKAETFCFKDKEMVSKATTFSTTLNLNSEIIEDIEKLQIEFKTIFDCSRVYKPFVIKLILFKAYLNEINA